MLRTTLSALILSFAACATPAAAPTPVLVAAGPSSHAQPAGKIAGRLVCYCEAECVATGRIFSSVSITVPSPACANALSACTSSGCTTCTVGTAECQ